MAILLFIFGNKESAIFLSAITIFNICLGITQDTRARIALETLQLMMAIRVTRLNSDGKEEAILAEDVIKGEHIKLVIGDQIPCDGKILLSNGLEVSEALVTGESDSFPKNVGEAIIAGGIITAGNGVFEATQNFSDSRLAHLNKEARKYAAHPSPIQHAINDVIKYAGYIMFLVILFVVGRDIVTHGSAVKAVLDIGALASTIIPQGLVVITTLLFAFGAASYSKKHVLFQEINATEKLGRIKNLCMDKTGTLTENFLVVENMYVHEGFSEEKTKDFVAAYIKGSGDSSQTMNAVDKYMALKSAGTKDIEYENEVLSSLPFSSWRQYGGVELATKESILVGSPDIFMSHISQPTEKGWLTDIIKKHAHTGKRILCVARLDKQKTGGIPRDLSGTELSIISVFVFQAGLREGIREAISFFQKRGVKIRIISGDNVDTVRTIAYSAGVEGTDAVITGPEMDRWSVEDFKNKVGDYTIFARIVPEQKVKIIEAFKKDGFTAMVGDGANDALAIKKADLGIAMFDGVQATRSLADVILMKNSFTDLPGGVELADNFIRNIEIFAGMFLNQSIMGLLFFIIISAFGFAFPLTPLNITFINYFAVGIPGMLIGYWAIQPSGKIIPASKKPFLSLVLPFAIQSAIIGSIAVAILFALSPEYLKMAASNTIVIIGFAVCGIIFLVLAPRVYRGIQSKTEKWHLLGLAIFEVVLFFVMVKIPILVRFFNITTPLPSLKVIGLTLLILVCVGIGQYIAVRKTELKA
ncbi:MAG: HAD-IC family P-type ATPase [Candidatus Taylorbacteria bacterium]